MDIYDVASYFDGLDALDAYTGDELFVCQMDQYDSAERDSPTGWRRSCSSAEIVTPTRRVISVNDEIFLLGRTVKDYFSGTVIREHAVLHPSDGTYSTGTAKQVIDGTALTEFYGAKSYRKEQKEEGESSELFPLYDVYASSTETAERDWIVKGPDNIFYRVLDRIAQTGGYVSLFAAELGASALMSVTYVASSGVYDSASDAMIAEAPITISAILERYQTNYRYMTWAAEKFRNGDKVLTVSSADVAEPKNNDRVTISGVGYRVLSVQSDGSDCWELHIRQAEFNLSVET